MRYLLILLPILLSACLDSAHLGVVDVEPEKKSCQDATLVIGWDSVAVDPQPPKECKTGKVVTKWIWE